MGALVNPSDITIIITSLVEKLPDRVRTDLASRDLHVRQSAEATVAARIRGALEDFLLLPEHMEIADRQSDCAVR